MSDAFFSAMKTAEAGMKSLFSKFPLIVAACGALGVAQADTVWNESISGDLSNDGLMPSSLLAGLGSNIVVGTTGNSGAGIDRDYFSIVVPTGAELSSITLLANTFVSGSASFIGMQAGPQLTVSPTGAGAEDLLGFAHYGNDQIGQDLLPQIHIVPAIVGYPTALPSGTYSLWVQETGGPVSYGFDFVITPVPIPGAATLLLSGLLGLSGLARRLRSKP